MRIGAGGKSVFFSKEWMWGWLDLVIRLNGKSGLEINQKLRLASAHCRTSSTTLPFACRCPS